VEKLARAGNRAHPATDRACPSDRQLHFRNQAAFTVVTASGEHDIAIRKIDEDLVRLALVTAIPA
jgi:hypothetical protein